VETVAQRFQGRVRALSFSGVAPFGLAWQGRDAIIPRLSEVAPVLRAALARALELGLAPSVPAGCSLPRCLAPEHAALFRDGAPGDSSAFQGKSQSPGCAPCRFAPTCPGVWERYQALYGGDGLRPCP
jgi:hypothetical protein